ncbi:hypothetical protein [Caldibacillus debilis]|uniref:Flp pilus assembly protein TadB n=1 Tax=Caldibacillus debilis GB1 TaxID=1339248 RepID=A0A420VDQ3_9BACI|nr:hypothetical protein [Caldibacillus debilis]RKO61791.1 hypothetical protein Cdeb_01284 [Caldibacillus debilis GB1]
MGLQNYVGMQNAYLLPLLAAGIVLIGYVVFSQKLKYDPRFANDFSNRLYALSFVKPFVWFVNPNEEDPKVRKLEREIRRAGLGDVLNYRAFVSFQVLLFIVEIVLYLFFFFFLEEIIRFFDFIFRITEPTTGDFTMVKLVIALIFLFALFIPREYVSRRAKRNEFKFTQELSVIQLSIILMLRAKRPLSEILYFLGRNQTQYRRIFEKAYRIYLRNKQDCWNYLRKEFEGTGFVDTIDVLANIDNYSRDETVYVLEHQLETLIQLAEEGKHKGAAFGNLFSQFSMAVPFIGVGLLGALPFAMYIFSMISEQTNQTSIF